MTSRIGKFIEQEMRDAWYAQVLADARERAQRDYDLVPEDVKKRLHERMARALELVMDEVIRNLERDAEEARRREAHGQRTAS